MSLLFAALLLPTLFWDQPPNTADLLRKADIHAIAVPPSQESAWKQVSGFTVEALDPSRTTKLPKPGVRFRVHEASATSAPWVDSDAWRILRQPSASFFYEAPGESAAIAAAEAFTYGAKAVIHTDEGGLKPLGAMLAFLSRVQGAKRPPLGNFEFIDDGTPESGEFMNLLIRRNFLFRVVKSPDPSSAVTVKLGSSRYPRSEAANPSLLAEKVRAEITDEKRVLRIYGSEIVVARLEGDENSARVYLLNYAGNQLVVDGIRVRVLGKYTHFKVSIAGVPDQSVSDPLSSTEATEFTLKHLETLAVIDLAR